MTSPERINRYMHEKILQKFFKIIKGIEDSIMMFENHHNEDV